MSEQELIAVGIGGQGVQLLAQVLAEAALAEGRHARVFGSYGGEMRGGSTASEVVVADGPIDAPPMLAETGTAVAMHHEFWPPVGAKVRSGGTVFVNAGVFEGELDAQRYRVIEVPATDRAIAHHGSPLVASMVMLGAYVAVTGVVGLDSAVAAMRAALPPYRRQHADGNEAALRDGAALLDSLSVRAARATTDLQRTGEGAGR